MGGWLWAIFTVLAAASQTMRNAMQRELVSTVGTIGATHVRFLFGLPFAALFMLAILLATGESFPTITPRALAWILVGGSTQIAATALLLMAMRDKSFLLITALNKIEPVHVALFGLVFLGDTLTPMLAAAILIATLGVVVMSWPKTGATENLGLRPILLGIAAGAMFGAAAVGYRGGILAIESSRFYISATAAMVTGLAIQVVVLTSYLLVFDRKTLAGIMQAWRQSMIAGFMGAFASQMWFSAFALESAAKVRTLALVEIFFAGLVSRSLFKQSLASRQGFGIVLIVIGVVILLNL